MTLLELMEDWLRETVCTGLMLLSLLGVVAVSFSADGAWTGLGVAAGLSATVAVFVPLARGWSPPRHWLTLLGVTVFDVVVILVLLHV
jgi:hypothetical protein